MLLRLGAPGTSGPAPPTAPVVELTEADGVDVADTVGEVLTAELVVELVEGNVVVGAAPVDPVTAGVVDSDGESGVLTVEFETDTSVTGLLDAGTALATTALDEVTPAATALEVAALDTTALDVVVTAAGSSEATAVLLRKIAVSVTRLAEPTTQTSRQPRLNRVRAERIPAPVQHPTAPSATMRFQRFPGANWSGVR